MNNLSVQDTFGVTEARSRLGSLVSQACGERTYLLTKRGRPKAVLVDARYWQQVLAKLKELYQVTFIEPKLTKYTREFSEKEIEQWAKEDRL